MEMEKGLVTVVVPVYGVEKYLDQCVESIVNQTYKNLEILLVDDGSPDRCPQICDAWAQKDSRIHVIHKENEGLGMARNTGIENARGEYICFFDSDDYVALNTIEKAYNAIVCNSADIAIFGFYVVSAAGKYVEKHIPNTPKSVYRDDEIKNYLLPNLISGNPNAREDTDLNLSACMALFDMKLITENQWRFVSERRIVSEDVYSLLRLYNAVTVVAVVPEALYYYRENVLSVTREYQEDRYQRLKVFYEESLALCDALKYPDIVKKRLRILFLSFTIAALKQIVAAQLSSGKKLILIKKIIEDSLLQSAISVLDMRFETMQRKLLFTAMKYKWYSLAYCMIALKAKS